MRRRLPLNGLIAIAVALSGCGSSPPAGSAPAGQASPGADTTIRLAPVAGLQLAYRTYGPAEGEPMLLIGGTGMKLVDWPERFVRAWPAAATGSSCKSGPPGSTPSARRTGPPSPGPARRGARRPCRTRSRTWRTTATGSSCTTAGDVGRSTRLDSLGAPDWALRLSVARAGGRRVPPGPVLHASALPAHAELLADRWGWGGTPATSWGGSRPGERGRLRWRTARLRWSRPGASP